MSSISQTDGSFRQNYKGLEAYQNAVIAGQLPIERGFLLSDEDRRRRTLVMELMCRARSDYASLSTRLGVDVATKYATEIESLADLEADGLLTRDASGITITKLGELFRRIIAMRFDEYLAKGPKRFSKTV
jgi:oxygen-independent coproporphyrinogen-3 oxidase